MYERVSSHIREKREECGAFDIFCLLRRSSTTTTPPPAPSTYSASNTTETTGLIDIDNAVDGGSSVSPAAATVTRETRSTVGHVPVDDDDYVTREDSSGDLPDGSGDVDPGKRKHHKPTSPIGPTSTAPTIPGQPSEYRSGEAVCPFSGACSDHLSDAFRILQVYYQSSRTVQTGIPEQI